MRCVLCYPSTYEKLPFNRLSGWKPFSRKATATYGPKVVRGTLYVEDEVPRDTYFDFGCSPECVEWFHGNLFVNGFNIGRYHTAGPQKTLYIPGPFLKQGDNEVRVILTTASDHEVSSSIRCTRSKVVLHSNNGTLLYDSFRLR